ncbi:acyltransferase family protein [Pseudolysinimonas sp.]|uniref:acyltransferase family protein n=1 Tax=Pseudolysinimonas sp. TaxID=2680009 RepID=UPI003F7FA1FF
MSLPAPAARAALDLSKRDLTLDLARVVCVLLVVVIHLLEVGVGVDPATGAITVSRPLEHQRWFDGVTWVLQIMPLFFVVGGFAGMTAWRSLRRRGGTGADFVRGRVLRLAQPALPLFVFYVVALGIATFVGAPHGLVQSVAVGAGSPLWFIAAYTVCQALVPALATWHERNRWAPLAVLFAGVVAVELVRHLVHGRLDFSYAGVDVRLDGDAFGLLNMLFVWPLVQQFGFWYADGWFDRRRPWQLMLLGLGSWATLFAMVLPGGWSPDMLTNLNPPTLPLVALGLSQACALRLLKPVLSRLMRTRGARAIVFLAGTRLMTIYLWHLPIIIALAGLALLIPGASPTPGSAAWWWSRILVYVVVLALLFALSFVVGRWEAPRELGPTPPPGVVALAAVLTFLPTFLEIELFLSLPLAVLGTVCFGVAVLLLGRWPARTAVPS